MGELRGESIERWQQPHGWPRSFVLYKTSLLLLVVRSVVFGRIGRDGFLKRRVGVLVCRTPDSTGVVDCGV